jgi:hypothetical protein
LRDRLFIPIKRHQPVFPSQALHEDPQGLIATSSQHSDSIGLRCLMNVSSERLLCYCVRP